MTVTQPHCCLPQWIWAFVLRIDSLVQKPETTKASSVEFQME